MNNKSIVLVVFLMLFFTLSCNDPETIVTNFVHRDGSVTRKIEMRSIEGDKQKRFNKSNIQVPIDSSWSIGDSCEVDEKGDTVFVRRAVKHFNSVEEINKAYLSDSGSNKNIPRKAEFKKSFKWFNTQYRFSEKIEKRLSFGYPVKNFLNKEELQYFYSPEVVQNSNLDGPDSVRYRALRDSVKYNTDRWTSKNMVSEWIGQFSDLISAKADTAMSLKNLKSREDELTKLISKDDKALDSLWKNGIILRKFIGESKALKYKTEADSALSIVTNKLMPSFENYSVRIVMPGKLIGTNGFIDSTKKLIWPVTSDYFLSEPYEMWAESKTPNTWAWVVSGIFLLFVLSGVVIRVIKKD
jgi:hypothetical protein